MKRTAIYYLIWDRVVGKQEEGRYYIFRNGQWAPDVNSVIRDHLVGFDPSEPPGSPYRYGNGSIMFEMDEIPYERAMELTGEAHEFRSEH